MIAEVQLRRILLPRTLVNRAPDLQGAIGALCTHASARRSVHKNLARHRTGALRVHLDFGECLLRTRVNKDKKKGRIAWFGEGKFMRRGWYKKWRENGRLSHRKEPV